MTTTPSPARTRFSAPLDAQLARVTRRRGELGAPQVLVSAERLGLDYSFGDRELPFHAASIGKMVTATLIMRLVESGALSLDSPLTGLLPSDETAGLFEVGGEDHSGRVTPIQLLSHTSGVADYFGGPVTTGADFLSLIVTHPDRFWNPADFLAFSRDRQRPVGRPGARFSYSDTGYVLLGRIIEEATGRPFHTVVHEQVFEALGMADSFLPHRSEPARRRTTAPDLARFWLDDHEASRFTSVSCDWAGGGIVSTLDDLARFSRAFSSDRLLTAESRAVLGEMRSRLRSGIRYGAGLMEIRFGEFAFPLRRLPRPIGHIGVLGTHLFHDPVHDAHIVMNFHSTREMTRSFRTLIRIEQQLMRVAARG